jgi:hypothetical protein
MVPPIDKQREIASIYSRRCDECHAGKRPSGGVLDPDLIYNLTDPEKSLALLMPLAADAGGNGPFHKKRKSDDPAVVIFKDRSDPDYRALLSIIISRKARLDQIKRFDMPGFRPNEHYLREMKFYGVLPPDFDIEHDPVDPYELDQRYWKSLRHRPIQTTSR